MVKQKTKHKRRRKIIILIIISTEKQRLQIFQATLPDNDRAFILTRPFTIRQNIQLTGNNWINIIFFTDSFLLHTKSNQMNSVFKSWDTFQYSLQCPFYTFLIQWCCQLYFLNLNSHTITELVYVCVRVCLRVLELEERTTCLPARARRMNFFSFGGAYSNSEMRGEKMKQMTKPHTIGTKRLTFDNQSCRSCETTRFSNPCRLMRTSSILI